MAEMMDGGLLEPDRGTQAPGVMEIIGGLGLLQSLEDAVDAAAGALEGLWGDPDAFIEERGTSEGVSPEPETAAVGLAEADCEGIRGDPPAAPSADVCEAASPDKNEPLNERLPNFQTDPPAEVPETSPQKSTEAAIECPVEPPPATPMEYLAELQTQPDLELSMRDASGNSTDLVTPKEQVEEVMMSEAKATPLPDGEEAHLNGGECLMGEEPGEEVQNDGQEEVEEEQVEKVMMSEAKATPLPNGEEAWLNRPGGTTGVEPSQEVHNDNLEEVEEEHKGGEEEEGEEKEQWENSPQQSICSHGCSHQPPGKTRSGQGRRKKSIGGANLSKYNTVSYRTIRRGNTRQRIDEFESMIHI